MSIQKLARISACAALLLVTGAGIGAPIQWSSGAGGNDHWYEVVIDGDINWQGARTTALAEGGYLATITSASENSFVVSLAGAVHAWIGATDQDVEGEWRWADGPEAGQLFWLGNASGTAFGYANWAPTQPDNATGETEDWGQLFYDGKWNDWTNATFAGGYVVEYDSYTPCTSNCDPQPPGPSGIPTLGTLSLMGLGLATLGFTKRRQGMTAWSTDTTGQRQARPSV